LPFIEQDDIYKNIDLNQSWDSKKNERVVHTEVRSLMCPSFALVDPERPPGMTSYLGITGIEPDAATLQADSSRAGFFGYDRQIKEADIKDGLEYTIMIVETGFETGPWAAGGQSNLRGIDLDQKPYLGVARPFGGNHFAEKKWFGTAPSLANVAFADGSVKKLKDTIDPRVFEALVTIAGGEKVPEDY
jgi:prepilin-type processing-associated H-X9-DG protein